MKEKIEKQLICRSSTREWVEACEEKVEQARKETAREILNRLKYLSKENARDYTKWDGNIVRAVDVEYILNDIEEIVKEYGVEVDE